VQYNIYALNALLLLYFLKKILKTPFYLVHSSFGLGGANAPLHLPWLRLCIEPFIDKIFVDEKSNLYHFSS